MRCILLILIQLFVFHNTGEKELQIKQTFERKQVIPEQKPISTDTLLYSIKDYDSLKIKIKFWEGFVDSIYEGRSHEPLIGYGHYVWNIENFTYHITKEQADSLLDKDLYEIIKLVHDSTGLEGKKLLAVTSFVYNIGIGKYCKSSLHKKYISEGKTKGLNREWKRWVKYKRNDKWHSSPRLLTRRIWELSFYNTKDI